MAALSAVEVSQERGDGTRANFLMPATPGAAPAELAPWPWSELETGHLGTGPPVNMISLENF